MAIMEQCIPKATICPRRNLPWINKHIRANIRKRNMAYRKGRETCVEEVSNTEKSSCKYATTI